MIVNSQIVYDLTVGDPGRVPEPNDNAVQVPPAVLPSVLALRPTRIAFGIASGEVIPESLVSNLFLARVNQIAVTQAIVTLPPGLYEIELSMASSFDYTPAPPLTASSVVAVNLGTGTVCVLLSRFPAVGSFTDYARFRVLLREPEGLALFVPATGVTDDLAVNLTTNIIRIL